MFAVVLPFLSANEARSPLRVKTNHAPWLKINKTTLENWENFKCNSRQNKTWFVTLCHKIIIIKIPLVECLDTANHCYCQYFKCSAEWNRVCHLVLQNTPCWVPRYCKPLLLSVFQMQFRTKQGLSPCAAKYPLPRYCKPLLLSVFQMQFRTKQGLSRCAAKYPLLSA